MAQQPVSDWIQCLLTTFNHLPVKNTTERRYKHFHGNTNYPHHTEPNRTPRTVACPLRERWRPELGIFYRAGVGSDYELYLWEEKDTHAHIHTQCSQQALQQKHANKRAHRLRVVLNSISRDFTPKNCQEHFSQLVDDKHTWHQTDSPLSRWHRMHTKQTFTSAGKTCSLTQVQEEDII